MPRGNGMGPLGQGPMTGRGAGFCAGYGVPGYMNPQGRRGMGFRRGMGRGMGRGAGFAWQETVMPPAVMPETAVPQASPADTVAAAENPLDTLLKHSDMMLQAIDDLRKRIESLESDKSIEKS